jgi:hypothetical protein
MPLCKKLALAWRVGNGPVPPGDEPRAMAVDRAARPVCDILPYSVRDITHSRYARSGGLYDTDGGLSMDRPVVPSTRLGVCRYVPA